MSRFLVIGSNSFSGSSFIQHLLKEDHEVMGVSRSEEIHQVYLPYKWLENGPSGFKFHQVDINNDLERYTKPWELIKIPQNPEN